MSPGSIIRGFTESLHETSAGQYVKLLLRVDVCVAGHAAFKTLVSQRQENDEVALEDAAKAPAEIQAALQASVSKVEEPCSEPSTIRGGDISTKGRDCTQHAVAFDVTAEAPLLELSPTLETEASGGLQDSDEDSQSSAGSCGMLSAQETITGVSSHDVPLADESVLAAAAEVTFTQTLSEDGSCTTSNSARSDSVGSVTVPVKDETGDEQPDANSKAVFLEDAHALSEPATPTSRVETAATESSGISGSTPRGGTLADILSAEMQSLMPLGGGAYTNSPSALYSMPPPLDDSELSATPPWQLSLGGESAPAGQGSSVGDSFTGLWGTSHSAGSQPLSGLLGGLRHSALSNPLVAPLRMPRGGSREDLGFTAVHSAGAQIKPLSAARRRVGVMSPGVKPVQAPPGFSPPSTGATSPQWKSWEGSVPLQGRQQALSFDESGVRADIEALLDMHSDSDVGEDTPGPSADEFAGVASWQGLAQATAEAGLGSPTPSSSAQQAQLRAQVEAEAKAAAAAEAEAEAAKAKASADRQELLLVLGTSWALPAGEAADEPALSGDKSTSVQEVNADAEAGGVESPVPAAPGAGVCETPPRSESWGGAVDDQASLQGADAATQGFPPGGSPGLDGAVLRASPASSSRTPGTTPLGGGANESSTLPPLSFVLDEPVEAYGQPQFDVPHSAAFGDPAVTSGMWDTSVSQNLAASLLGGGAPAAHGGVVSAPAFSAGFDSLATGPAAHVPPMLVGQGGFMGALPHSGPPPPGGMPGASGQPFNLNSVAAMQMQMAMQMQQYAAGAMLGGGVPPPLPHFTPPGSAQMGHVGYPNYTVTGISPPGGGLEGGGVGGAPPSPTHAEARDMYAALHEYERQLMAQQAQDESNAQYSAYSSSRTDPKADGRRQASRRSAGSGISTDQLKAALAEYDTIRSPKHKKLSNRAVRNKNKQLAARVQSGLLGAPLDGDSIDSEEATMRRLLEKWEHRTAEQASAAIAADGTYVPSVASAGEVVWSSSSMPTASSSEYDEDIVFPQGAATGALKAGAGDDGTLSLSATDGCPSSQGSPSDAGRASPSQWTSGSSVEDVVFVQAEKQSYARQDPPPLHSCTQESEHSAALSSPEEEVVPCDKGSASKQALCVATSAAAAAVPTAATPQGAGGDTPSGKSKKNKKKGKKKKAKSAQGSPVVGVSGGANAEDSFPLSVAATSSNKKAKSGGSTPVAATEKGANGTKVAPAMSTPPVAGEDESTAPAPASASVATPPVAAAAAGTACAEADATDTADAGDGSSKKRARNKDYWKRRKALAKASKGGKGPSTGESK